MITPFLKILFHKTEFLLCLIITVHSFILTKLIFFPYPELFILPYLTNKGLLPYKEIWDNHFPGPFFLPVNLGTLGLVNELSAKYWQLGLMAISHLLIFYLTRLVTKSTKVSILANILFLIWHPFLGGWVLWIDSFLGIFYLVTFIFFYKFLTEKRNRFFNIFLTGLFLSIAFLFKQTALPIVFALFLFLLFYSKSPKLIFFFILGFLPLNILTLGYFWYLGILKEFWNWTILYHLSESVRMAYKSPEISELLKICFIYSPLLFICKLKEKKTALFFVIFIVGALLGYPDRFDTIHLQPSLPFIAILSAILFFTIKNQKNSFIPLKFIVVLYLIFTLKLLTSFYPKYISSDIWYFDKQTFQLSNQVQQLTKPGEEILLYGPVPLIYVFSNTIPAGRVFTLVFPWTINAVEDKYLNYLIKNPPLYIVRDWTFTVDSKPIAQFAPKINKFINANYETVKTIDNTEFMRKKYNLLKK